MAIRRVLYRLLWPAVFVLPLWVLVGRAFFGVPLGLQVLGQLVLVAGVVTARRSVRDARAVSWLDAGLLLLTWAAQVALGFFLVDGSAASSASSAFTRAVPGGDLDLSTALFGLSAVVTVAGGLGLLAAAVWQFLAEARRRVAASLSDLDRVAAAARADARVAGVVRGDPDRVIRITPRE
jgi:hypothetical protein